MPRVGQRPRDTEAESSKRMARTEFEAGFRSSRKGNYWRRWEGRTLTIFRRDDNTFSWVIAGDDGPRFSPSKYETEVEAMSSLASELEVGEW
ncbi:MAG: hypothetical protein EXS09_17435 [Gemmataceae bacterium]|nr:hypothetical protein [Gemmataceae bacterium]